MLVAFLHLFRLLLSRRSHNPVAPRLCSQCLLLQRHCPFKAFIHQFSLVGSPLAPSSSVWVYEKVKKDVQLSSLSGGTEINGCLALASPVVPVYPGEAQVIEN